MIKVLQKIINHRINRLQEAAFAMFMGYLLRVVGIPDYREKDGYFPTYKIPASFPPFFSLPIEAKIKKTTIKNQIEIPFKGNFALFP